MGKSSNNRRNRKRKENAQILEAICASKKKEKPTSDYDDIIDMPVFHQSDAPPASSNQEKYDADGALIIEVDDDLDFEDVETSCLAPRRGPKKKPADVERLYQWYLRRELGSPVALWTALMRKTSST